MISVIIKFIDSNYGTNTNKTKQHKTLQFQFVEMTLRHYLGHTGGLDLPLCSMKLCPNTYVFLVGIPTYMRKKRKTLSEKVTKLIVGKYFL